VDAREKRLTYANSKKKPKVGDQVRCVNGRLPYDPTRRARRTQMPEAGRIYTILDVSYEGDAAHGTTECEVKINDHKSKGMYLIADRFEFVSRPKLKKATKAAA
jgi:hypothetical protein